MMRQYAVVFINTFSLHSNFNLTSTVALLTNSFCRAQSIIMNRPKRKNVVRVRLGSTHSVVAFAETCVHVIESTNYFYRNPDSCHRTDNIPSFTLINLQSSNRLTSSDIMFFRLPCRAKTTYRDFSS